MYYIINLMYIHVCALIVSVLCNYNILYKINERPCVVLQYHKINVGIFRLWYIVVKIVNG